MISKEEGLYGPEMKTIIAAAHYPQHLATAVNDILGKFKDLAVVRLQLMAILPSYFEIESNHAQLLVQNLCHIIIADLKKTNVSAILTEDSDEPLTDNERKVIAYVAGHVFFKKI